MVNRQTFHIPVMGIGFTIDTPLKVSQYGIDSVISISDDILLEKLRKFYSLKYRLPYIEITDKDEDYRAERITSYLNLIKNIAEEKFEKLKTVITEKSDDIKKYFSMLPEDNQIKNEYLAFTAKKNSLEEIRNWLKDKLSMGSIDVNVMTKLDKENYRNNEKLPVEFNDAHAALRGYANSDLTSSLVLSAGMNPRLYTYLEEFEDFFPNENGEIKKKLILKVSDYRSALIQGKFLAKKGLWVSEYRIESGLNCGGHAFATDGFLLGPILQEFKNNREELVQSISEILLQALEAKGSFIPKKTLPLKITAQGGVGTAEEHKFLIDHYDIDSVGWGSPFLLVPEVVNVDDNTLKKLSDAKEQDLYLSDISPLGVPFNNLKGNSKDAEKRAFTDKGRPGSSCPKGFLSLNTEFTDRAICTASRQYQHLKIQDLKKQGLTEEQYNLEYNKVTNKSCLCVGLGTSALMVNDLDTKVEGEGVSVCPGPNMAYFSKVMTLSEITDHIYGRTNVISRNDRPNLFIKELGIYIDYLFKKFQESKSNLNSKQKKYFLTFSENLNNGINYYTALFRDMKGPFAASKSGIIQDLKNYKKTLLAFKTTIENMAIS